MNYYEELGVGQEATEQEIRKAHRRLVKLMHPDAQLDQGLKIIAEGQMRRLNAIVSTLLDSDQRRLYDRQLRNAHAAHHRPIANFGSWRGIPWWLASSIGAVILALVAVWLWADHVGNTFGSRSNRTIYLPPIESPVPALPPASGSAPSANVPDVNQVGAAYLPPAPTPAPSSDAAGSTPDRDHGGVVATVVPDEAATPKQPQAPQKRPAAAANPESLAKAASPDSIAKARTAKSAHNLLPEPQTNNLVVHPGSKREFSLPAGSLVAQALQPAVPGTWDMPAPPSVVPPTSHDYNSNALPAGSLPSAPSAAPSKPAAGTAPGEAKSGANGRDPLEGEWVYAPKEPERRRAGFYPPEYIHLKLVGSGDPGSLKGQYNAKYLVTDKPVSNEVNFQLASVSKSSRKFVWHDSAGAKGTLSIDPVDDHTIRVDWRTTSYLRGLALTSGHATLVRRE